MTASLTSARQSDTHAGACRWTAEAVNALAIHLNGGRDVGKRTALALRLCKDGRGLAHRTCLFSKWIGGNLEVTRKYERRLNDLATETRFVLPSAQTIALPKIVAALCIACEALSRPDTLASVGGAGMEAPASALARLSAIRAALAAGAPVTATNVVNVAQDAKKVLSHIAKRLVAVEAATD